MSESALSESVDSALVLPYLTHHSYFQQLKGLNSKSPYQKPSLGTLNLSLSHSLSHNLLGRDRQGGASTLAPVTHCDSCVFLVLQLALLSGLLPPGGRMLQTDAWS